MNLLGALLYDPTTAVSKSLATVIAMTALDTTNLRLGITIPTHGKVFVRMRCCVTYVTTTATLMPSILLGVMDGATVRGRVKPHFAKSANPASSINSASCVAEFVLTGLTPGAMSLDAAYGVEELATSSNIKYGGPNNTTSDDAWGAFSFEAWDPIPLPTAVAGGTGGLALVGSAITLTNVQGVKKNTALANFSFAMFDAAGDPKAGETVTATRSLDGAAFAACANSVIEIASGGYKITLAATDLNGDVVLLKFTSAGAKTQLITITTVQA